MIKIPNVMDYGYPINSSYMHPSSLFVACCELYESCLHATPAGHRT